MIIRNLFGSGLFAAAVATMLFLLPASAVWAQTGGAASHQAALACWDEVGSKAKLDNFDDLDFNVFTNQKWDELKRSHSENIIVHWPDGRTTTGIDVHIEDLRAMFVYAPDTRIRSHPIRISCGDLTAVTGVLEGRFTNPMPIGDGKTIAPTGKPFKLLMATFGRWENGRMAEEWLFWDNKTFLSQIGLTN